MTIREYCLGDNKKLRFAFLETCTVSLSCKDLICGFYAAEVSVHFEKQSVGSEKSFHGLCTFSVHFMVLIDRFHKDGGDKKILCASKRRITYTG